VAEQLKDDISLRHYIETRLNEYRDAHTREHQMLDDSLKLARQNTEYRLENLNNWKAQNQDERASLVSREAYESKHETLVLRIEAVEKSIATLAGVGATVALVLVVIEFVLRFVVK
jgi:hypothetical protein